MKKSIVRFLLAGVLLSSMFFFHFNDVSAASTNPPKHEMRASWISTVTNIDLKAGMNEADYTAWVKSTIKTLEEKNFNTVVFQVKPTADALYPSKLAPWSRYITGKGQGVDPGYDPLQIMLDTAHEHGMELHAWINPYRVTMASQSLDDLTDDNIAKKQPEWVVKHGSQYYLNPGIPGVQEYLVETVKELVENYDVDAVHMDDYFYPGKDFSDQATFEEFGGDFTDIGDWRRNNVSQLVSSINDNIKTIKPWVQFGISPSGIWRNSSDDPNGSDTQGGAPHYDALYADSLQWVREGSIDYLTPQIYWSRQLAIANYSILLDWWSEKVDTQAQVHPVNLYIGMADYKVNTNSNNDNTWYNPREIPEQILDNRANGKVKGQMHFTLRDILNNPIGYQDIVSEEIYPSKALAPATAWNGAEKPNKPNEVSAEKNGDSVTITIDNQNQTDAKKYVIYRFAGNKAGDYNNPENIVGVIYSKEGSITFTDQNIDPNQSYTYGVSSISYNGVESDEATVAYTDEPEEITSSTMLSTLENYQGELSEQVYRSLTLHLTSVGHFEQQQSATKVVKHMEGFKQLIDRQKDNQLISAELHDILSANADSLILKWRENK
ncbi:glycoside hydrolase family 10 protein [Bacillus niameyensis]|uniref:glycoside hydrolase family 10 protein n=1 Tax=Bacillus niameyensis TaxID=1522308 RepID=UPI0008410E7D|nr:family 10 glycosylhydrolase [Bacillus niameyensis]